MSLNKFLLIGLLLFLNSITYANTMSLTNCSDLKDPKTIVVVHAEWCSHCKHFLPIYKALSDNSNYSSWKFYTVTDNDFHAICGTEISTVPTLFKNNMSSTLQGDVSAEELEAFLKQ